MTTCRTTPTTDRISPALAVPAACNLRRAVPLVAGRTACCAFPLFLLPPPYERTIPLPDGRLPGAHALQPGTIVGLELSGREVDWSVLGQTLQQVRVQLPVTPVVARINPEIDDPLYVAARAAGLPIRALLSHGRPMAPLVRRHLTNPPDLGADVVEWLTLRGVRLSPALADLIRRIFAEAPHHRELSTLCKKIGAVESSARFRFHKKRLPPPSRWLQAARALHAVLRLQAEPERPLFSLALDLGYADHSALSHQITRTFRARPGELRATLGWEWLLQRWLEGRGLRPVSSGAPGATAGQGVWPSHPRPTAGRAAQ